MKYVLWGSATALLAFGAPVWAASQGSLGATSTGSVSVAVQSDVVPRLVQVLGLSDLTVASSSRSDIDATAPGTSMAFCVVDNYGGRVRLTLTNSEGNAGAGGDWIVKNAATGLQVTFYAMVSPNAPPYDILGQNVLNSASFVAVVRASEIVTSNTNCGSGNVKLHVRTGTIPQTLPSITFQTTITIVAAPE